MALIAYNPIIKSAAGKLGAVVYKDKKGTHYACSIPLVNKTSYLLNTARKQHFRDGVTQWHDDGATAAPNYKAVSKSYVFTNKYGISHVASAYQVFMYCFMNLFMVKSSIPVEPVNFYAVPVPVFTFGTLNSSSLTFQIITQSFDSSKFILRLSISKWQSPTCYRDTVSTPITEIITSGSPATYDFYEDVTIFSNKNAKVGTRVMVSAVLIDKNYGIASSPYVLWGTMA